ncbi:unnamed protein product [Effrenium voratum]|nr:unnamed protein product [Effrenium voratum]
MSLRERRSRRRCASLVLALAALCWPCTFTPGSTGRPSSRPVARCAMQTVEASQDDFEGEHIYTDVDPASIDVGEEGGYTFDDVPLEDEKPEDIGPVHYYGVTQADGIAIFQSSDLREEAEKLFPGDVVAAQVPINGSLARLLDGRGWLDLTLLGTDLEEVQPWAAQIMKKPGISRADAASLGYLSLDDSKLTPLAQHLPLPHRVVAQLEKRGVRKASPIQEAVFADIYKGKSFCLQSQTGTGKTLAMLLPLLTAMSEESQWGPGGDKIVVVTSSRELAVQLFSDIDSMGFYPKGKGFTTMVIVGNVAPSSAVMDANVIIGTPNELGGMLHKDNDIVTMLNTKLRGIVLDEVDEYTTAPRLFASKWAIKKKRRIYNEKKQTLSGRLGDFNTGVIEWFLKRSLAYSRRRDLQVLAASATMNRNMARKVYRLLRWDPLGRWYNKPPPFMRPISMMKAEWQSVPMMPTLPLDIKHRYVPVIPSDTDTNISNKHWTRKPYAYGGLPRLKVKSLNGQRGMGQRPVAKEKAIAMLDGLHDALRNRKGGSSLLVICRSVGVTVREAVRMLHEWGFHEAEAVHESLWTDPKDWPSRWAIKYNYDQQDKAVELGQRHQELNERARSGQNKELPVGSYEWQEVQRRKEAGEATAPVLVGFEGLGRGIHFDGVETVYILGLPQKPSAYMHYAGRVGRLGQKPGKVVSILPKAGAKVLQAWASKIGPGVHFKREAIERIRSAEVHDVESYKLPLRSRRRLERERPRRKEEKKPLLLPEPEDPLRMPTWEDEELEPEELEPERVPIPEKVADAVRQNGRAGEVGLKKVAAELQRATSRWPGPERVPRYVTRGERWKIERAERRKPKQ